jgi:phosphatidylserine/phosphatidylglycerophosphate/cardiolipin synthase-like enzyme
LDDIQVSFLCEGCQKPEDVARKVADFISQATETIDMATYSFHLCPGAEEIVTGALKERADAGVAIRIAYDAGSQQSQIEEPGHDACDPNTPNFVSSLGFPSKAIEGYRSLMHDKYIIIDGSTPEAEVWTGSTNFTDESWSLQENNIVLMRSPIIAALYENDFSELWVDGNIATTGINDSGEATLRYDGKSAFVLVNFAPGEGEWIDESIARYIDRTQERLTIACVVCTSGRIIESLQGLMKRNVPIEGVYDWSQMEGVKYQWSLVPDNNWKITAWEEIVQYGKLVGKHSTPYTPTSQHDYMHNKVMVLDDLTITGSYNFSRHAQQNAENVLMIQSEALAETYKNYIDGLVKKFNEQPKPAEPQAATAPPAPDQ